VRVDEISLTLPADSAFRRVAHLVLGGLAMRLELTYEKLEDIALALDALLQRSGSEGEVTVRVRIEGNELRTVVGPLAADVLRELDEEPGEALGLRRILDAVCDRVSVADPHVELTKRIDGKR
jgi:anti-sigma regulatory factor (Ser/Thr protein kinase)